MREQAREEKREMREKTGDPGKEKAVEERAGSREAGEGGRQREETETGAGGGRGIGGRNTYDSIEIPTELEETVRNAIEKASGRRERKRVPGRISRILTGTAAAAAGVLIVFAAGLNSSRAFAESMSQVPGIGALAQVLTVRSFYGMDGDYSIQAKVPEIVDAGEESSADAQSGIAGEANRQIAEIVDGYMARAKEEFEAYKEAFFAEGGTQEEWNNRQMDISVDYNVKYQDGAVLSLELITFKGWINAQEERHYYNLDLAADRELSLEDLLGSDYVEQCNREVVRQIEERMAADENQIFFGFGEDDGLAEGFTTVDENTDFYIDGDKEVVLVFPEYSIAPGYMGITEFKVGKAEGI